MHVPNIASKKITLAEPVFYSICGEGTEIGTPALFIRTQGCNLTCNYCDSKNSWGSGGIEISIGDLIEQLEMAYCKVHCRRVFLTGGEPTIQENILALMQELKRHVFDTMLQTNGTKFLPGVFDLAVLLSVDIKGPSSKQPINLDVVQKIYDRYVIEYPGYVPIQFKFVIASEQDFTFAKETINRCRLGTFVLQPEYGTGSLKQLADWVLQDIDLGTIDIRILPQLHKIIGVK